VTTIASIRRQIEQARAAIPEPPEGPLNPIVPPCDGLPPPRGCRLMNSEEVMREVQRLLSEVANPDGQPPSYWDKLTQDQRDELDARFEASGGIERVERMQRDLLASEART
jgi:hypothetical protein